jgi:hypothetical protein
VFYVGWNFPKWQKYRIISSVRNLWIWVPKQIWTSCACLLKYKSQFFPQRWVTKRSVILCSRLFTRRGLREIGQLFGRPLTSFPKYKNEISEIFSSRGTFSLWSPFLSTSYRLGETEWCVREGGLLASPCRIVRIVIWRTHFYYTRCLLTYNFLGFPTHTLHFCDLQTAFHCHGHCEIYVTAFQMLSCGGRNEDRYRLGL